MWVLWARERCGLGGLAGAVGLGASRACGPGMSVCVGRLCRARGPEGPVRPFVWGVCVGRAGAFGELGRGRVGEWGPSVSVRD